MIGFRKNVHFPSFLAASFLFSSAAFAVTGGMDGGGGTSLNNELIEQYIVDVRSLDGFLAQAEPILNRLKTDFPNLTPVLDQTLNDLTWYLVPSSLEQIASRTTGLPLESSTQVAVQNLQESEVFIDRDAYRDLGKASDGFPVNEKAKGALILHEIFMHIECSSKCAPDDYARIRKLVNMLIKPQVSTDALRANLRSFLFVSLRFGGEWPTVDRLLFSPVETKLYSTIYGAWFNKVQGSCKSLPPAYSASDLYGNSMDSSMTNANEYFHNSDLCKESPNVCSGLPYLTFISCGEMGVCSDLFKLFGCPIN